MPINVPQIDGRTYDELRAEALRRIPVHNPDWTNFNASDPGVTLVELFAFMTESLLYRANQIPERNRRAFLGLLGLPLFPGAPARGVVTLSNEGGPLVNLSLDRGVEVLAGSVPFRTETGLDVLPVETRVYTKRRRVADQAAIDKYRQLYASYADADGTQPPLTIYETTVLSADGAGIDLVRDTVDGCLWLAILTRPRDRDADALQQARAAIGGRVLSLGIVPAVAERTARLGPTATSERGRNHLRYAVPRVNSVAGVSDVRYRDLDAVDEVNVLAAPGIVQLTLPEAAELDTWRDLDPLESGVGWLPPALDEATTARVVTWVRVKADSAQPAGILWAAANAAMVAQREPVLDEALPDGTGDPDQVVRLARRPVVPGSVRLTVTDGHDATDWTAVEDLRLAGPELVLDDPSRPPGWTPAPPRRATVFVLDAEAGELRFGDGDHGVRPPLGALLRASYDVSAGTAGNLGRDAIVSGPALPPGVKVTNPVRTWGGNDAESVRAGERRVTGFLRNGERLVTAEDHARLAIATPEVEVGRVEVIPTYDPRLPASEPGDAPGAVTLMVIPRHDLLRPDAPEPDGFFLDAICRFLEPRRLVTSELFLRGPDYVPVWVSIGVEISGERSVSETREAVRRAITALLSPLPVPPATDLPPWAHQATGWPLRYPVQRAEVATHAGRAAGVLYVSGVLLAGADGRVVDRGIDLRGLQLPRLAGISVVVGDPVPIADLQGAAPVEPGSLPVPASPEVC